MAVWNEMSYRFTCVFTTAGFRLADDCGNYCHEYRSCFAYHCCQNAERPQPAKKFADVNEQCDRIAMSAFECEGWLHITVNDTSNEVWIKLQHKIPHVKQHLVTH